MTASEAGLIRELMFFGLAVLRGILILVIYDVIRIFRRVFPHGVWSVALEDILYWLLSAFLIFQLIYRENDGAIRGYALAAVAVGMFAYHQTASSWLVEHLAWILNLCFDVIRKPLRAVSGKICKFVRLLYRFCKKKLKKRFREFIMILFS